jgi:hypothetical protein
VASGYLSERICVVFGNPTSKSSGDRIARKLYQKGRRVLIHNVGNDLAANLICPALRLAVDFDVVSIHDIGITRAEPYIVL